ncbi:MAG: ion transporter [Chloroflexota bacterium]
MRIARFVQETDTPAGRAFNLCVLVLIIYSITTLSIETLPDLSPATRAALDTSDVIITLLFTIEYLLRLITAPNKRAYIFSFYGMIDLLAIAPFYLALELDLKGIRALHLFHLFLIFKLIRYNKAMQRFGKALAQLKEEAILFLVATGILLYLSAAGIYYFENEAQPENFQSIFHSLWWAVTTLTTVGYGDVYPITVGGRLFTFVVLMLGLGTVAVPAGLIASALSKVRTEEAEEE